MPPGLECYKSIQKVSDKCIIPCNGVYAEVIGDVDARPEEEIKKFKDGLHFYKEYKSGFLNRTEGKYLIIVIYSY